MKVDTIEGNKLIAEFMGESINYEYKRASPSPRVVKRILKYHTSWDWLKPVVDKIFTYSLAYPEQTKVIRDISIVVNIQGCYEKVIQFIIWYNNQTKLL
jgi:hypothetical protein